MTATTALRIGIAELRRRPGNRAEVRRAVPMGGLTVATASVAEDSEVVLEATLESLSDGITVHGTVEVPWVGECRRCLGPTSGTVSAPIDEVFKDDPDGTETLPLEGDFVDLGDVVHDAVVLSLPLAPLCRSDCPGPDPADFPVGSASEDTEGSGASQPPVDPRWAALDQLRFDSGPSDG